MSQFNGVACNVLDLSIIPAKSFGRHGVASCREPCDSVVLVRHASALLCKPHFFGSLLFILVAVETLLHCAVGLQASRLVGLAWATPYGKMANLYTETIHLKSDGLNGGAMAKVQSLPDVGDNRSMTTIHTKNAYTDLAFWVIRPPHHDPAIGALSLPLLDLGCIQTNPT